jgi:hypothetical protein
MKFKILVSAVFILLILSGFVADNMDAMSWPHENAALVRNFASNDRGRPILGMVFSGSTPVLAAEKGEVIFTRGNDDVFSRLPSPLGAWSAVDHSDGLISIYSRYSDAPPAEDAPLPSLQVERQQPIAVSGISGWAAQNGFYFQVFDRRERRWINPAMIITPQTEWRLPQILSVDIRNSQGAIVPTWGLSQGQYTIIVNTTAAGAPWGTNFAPQRIICSVNGAEAGTLSFESISARDGTLMIYRNGLNPVRQIYSTFPSYEAANVFLSRGQANLEIIVQDVAGNSRNYINRMYIN